MAVRERARPERNTRPAASHRTAPRREPVAPTTLMRARRSLLAFSALAEGQFVLRRCKAIERRHR